MWYKKIALVIARSLIPPNNHPNNNPNNPLPHLLQLQIASMLKWMNVWWTWNGSSNHAVYLLLSIYLFIYLYLFSCVYRSVREPTSGNNGSTPADAGQPQGQQKPSALTSVIYPVLSKLLKSNQEEGDVIAALAQLKIAFDNAERAKPGITHSLIAQIIETLKRYNAFLSFFLFVCFDSYIGTSSNTISFLFFSFLSFLSDSSLI